ncbi:hypothetical protein B0J18DRAFT_455887 [Chaetomium sp. MPI-SDFR-AT-0129]|nr:hypothetical protein B0J18DRAFT_455887 [Chaetomium sp. MPI-SDFR-AT-0129]
MPPSNNKPITPTTLPSPLLRTAAILSFIPALPLCITHGALSNNVVPAVGLIPLFFSAVVSLFLVLLSRGGGRKKGRAKRKATSTSGVWSRTRGEEVREDAEEGETESLAGNTGLPDSDEEEVQAGGRVLGIRPEEDEGYYEGGTEYRVTERRRGTVLTHRILVFVVDVILAASLMIVLVFTWIRTGNGGDRRPKLAMLAAYSTIPLLVNFLIHLFLAVREFVAGLAIPGLVEYTAWRALPADCPHCGNRLRPDSLPPIPWYETISRPKVSLPQVTVPSMSAPSLPSFTLPNFPGFKGPREWGFPKWTSRNGEYSRLLADDDHHERDPYRDDAEDPLDVPSHGITTFATGSNDPTPVEVIGKKDKKARTVSSSADDEVV